jgi:hypothetical protein
MFISVIIEKHRAEELLSATNGIWPSGKKMVKVELFYLPIYLFTIELEDRKARHYHEMISVDGIKGEFAFFRESDSVESPNEHMNSFSYILAEPIARKIALAEYQRFLLKNNLKSSNSSGIVSFSKGVKAFYPYWIGYFRRKNGYDFEVIDAVGGGKQGIKMRPVFIELLLQSSTGGQAG